MLKNCKLRTLIFTIMILTICSFETIISSENSYCSQQDLQIFISRDLNDVDVSEQDMVATFLQQIYLRHPEFFKNLNLSGLSPQSSAILAAAAASVDPNSHLVKNVSPDILSKSHMIKMITPQEWRSFVIKEVRELDLAIVSFKATGDNIFLIKVLEAINQNDEALILGYEFNNRRYLNQLFNNKAFNYDDLWAEIDRQEKHCFGFKQKVILAGAGIWGLEILLHQDAHSVQCLNEIYKENSNLNYWKKIQCAIK